MATSEEAAAAVAVEGEVVASAEEVEADLLLPEANSKNDPRRKIFSISANTWTSRSPSSSTEGGKVRRVQDEREQH